VIPVVMQSYFRSRYLVCFLWGWLGFIGRRCQRALRTRPSSPQFTRRIAAKAYRVTDPIEIEPRQINVIAAVTSHKNPTETVRRKF
jgi:hypothetical protein